MLGICQGLGAETRYHPEHRYFTAMVWTGWDTPCGMGEALAVQQKIQRTAAQYPAVVCYASTVQHTGLYGLSAVCKKGRLVPLAQERPFLIFYLGGMYEWALFQIWIMSFKTARLPFPTPLRKMVLWICRRRLPWNRRQQVLRLQLRLQQRRPANRQPPPNTQSEDEARRAHESV